MSVRRFLRSLLLTCSVPILGGVGATWWFSRQELAGAGYECSTRLTSEHWMDYYRQDPSRFAFTSSYYGTPAEHAISFFTTSTTDEQVRDVLAAKAGVRSNFPVKVEADEVDKAVIEVRVVGPDPAFTQVYARELVNAYEAWSNKSADQMHEYTLVTVPGKILEYRVKVKGLERELRNLEKAHTSALMIADGANMQQLKRERDAALEMQKYLEKIPDAEAEKLRLWRMPVVVLEGPSTPAKVKTPLNEAIFMGSIVGGGMGVLVMLLMAVTSILRRKQRPASVSA